MGRREYVLLYEDLPLAKGKVRGMALSCFCSPSPTSIVTEILLGTGGGDTLPFLRASMQDYATSELNNCGRGTK